MRTISRYAPNILIIQNISLCQQERAQEDDSRVKVGHIYLMSEQGTRTNVGRMGVTVRNIWRLGVRHGLLCERVYSEMVFRIFGDSKGRCRMDAVGPMPWSPGVGKEPFPGRDGAEGWGEG